MSPLHHCVINIAPLEWIIAHHKEDAEVSDEGATLVDSDAGPLASDTLKLHCSIRVLLQPPVSQ